MATKKPSTLKSAKDYVRFSTQVQQSLEEMSKSIGSYANTMDTVQEVGINLTRMAVSLATTAGKYAQSVNSILQAVLPLLTSLPLLDKKTQGFLNGLQSTAGSLLSVVGNAESLARGAEQGLLGADANQLQSLLPELKKLPQVVEAALKSLKG